jgi:rfaE bifunctional protein nucleotidyltransferase chain/domain
MKPQIVYAAGVFDLLHYGHIEYLRNAKGLGTSLVVGLLTDMGAAAYKTTKPVMNYTERYMVLASIKYVDHIMTQTNTDPTETLKILKGHCPELFPNILVRASDVKEPIPGQEYIESQGGEVVIVPYSPSISSTEIKNRIKRNA